LAGLAPGSRFGRTSPSIITCGWLLGETLALLQCRTAGETACPTDATQRQNVETRVTGAGRP